MSVEKMVENAVKKVSEEPMENMEEVTSKDICPQHVIDEAKVEEAIERMYDRRQMDMYNSEDWNWSGLR